MIKLAWQELWRLRRSLYIALALLVVSGVAGAGLCILEASVRATIQSKSREFLSADLVAGSTRPFTSDEEKTLQDVYKPTRVASEIELSNMVSNERGQSGFAQVKGISASFPIYGDFEYVGEKPAAIQSGEVWVFQELAVQLGLKLGDWLKIGALKLRVKAIVQSAPGIVRGGLALAPQIFIFKDDLPKTQLMREGSQVFYRIYLETKRAAVLSEEMFRFHIGPDISLRTVDSANNSTDRFFSFFRLLFSTWTLLVVSLAWISTFFILQFYFYRQIKPAAIFQLYGASRARVLGIYLWQSVLISIVGIIISAFVLAILGLAVGILQSKFTLPIAVQWQLPGLKLLMLAGVQILVGLVFMLPFIVMLLRTGLRELLEQMGAQVPQVWRWDLVFTLLGCEFVLVLLARLFLPSWLIAFQLAGSLAVAIVLAVFLGKLFFKTVSRILPASWTRFRLIVLQLSRNRVGTQLAFLGVFFASLIFGITSHFAHTAKVELGTVNQDLPSFFLFNIPSDDLASLRQWTSEKSVSMRYESPMVLARFISINGKPPQEDSVRKFPVRISTRKTLVESEKIIEGRLWTKSWEGGEELPEVSVEQQYASRQGIQMNDILEYDIYGIEQKAKVTSIRRVRWADFHPNFFMILQPGVIDDAPASYLSVLYPTSNSPAKPELQNELVARFPNLTALDLDFVIKKIADLTEKLLLPVQWTSVVIALLCFVMVGLVINYHLQSRVGEFNLLRLMTLRPPWFFVFEYLVLAVTALLLGQFLAWGIVRSLTYRFFELPAHIQPWTLILTMTLVPFLIAYGVGIWAFRQHKKLVFDFSAE